MFHFGSGVLNPQFLAGLLKFVIWYCLLMPGGIFRSAIGKEPFYLYRIEFLSKMILHKVCRGIGGLVIVDFSCPKGRKTITANLVIDSTYTFQTTNIEGILAY